MLGKWDTSSVTVSLLTIQCNLIKIQAADSGVFKGLFKCPGKDMDDHVLVSILHSRCFVYVHTASPTLRSFLSSSQETGQKRQESKTEGIQLVEDRPKP